MSSHSLSTTNDPRARGLVTARIVGFLAAVLMIDAFIGYLAWAAVDTLV